MASFNVTAHEVALALSNGRRVTKSGNSFLISCPVPGHEDKNPSCLLFDKPGGEGIGITCKAGCSQEATWQALTDLGYVKKKAEKKFVDIADEDCKKEHVAEWKWLNADGSVHLITRRMHLLRPDGSIKKKVPYPKLPDGSNPGPGYPVIPLYLPDVLEAAKKGLCIVDVEGEPKADILRDWGICGTTTGASSKKAQWVESKVWEHFRGSELIVILDDNDVPGLAWAVFKAKKFREEGFNVKLIHLPGLGKRTRDHGKDIKDWKLAGHTKEEFIELVESWPLFEAAEFEPLSEQTNVVQMFAKAHEYLTDTYNMQHFLKRHGEDLLFLTDRGRSGIWCIWDGQRFKEDNKEQIMNLVEDANRHLEKSYEPVKLNPDQRDRWLRKSLDQSGLSNTERAARKKKAMISTELDDDPDILVVSNGLLYLPELELRPFSRSYRSIAMAPVAFDPDARCPKFLKYLDQWFCGDQELILFDQRHFGYCLTGHTAEQALVVNKGEGGGGKSQLLLLKQYCLGSDYFHKMPEALFKETDGQQNASGDYHQLVGKRLGVWFEVKKNTKLDDKKLKEVTDGGRLDARPNFKEVYNFQSHVKLIFNSNYPLNIPHDDSLTRRVLYVPFDAIVKEKVVGLADLLWEEEGPGIFNWYCQGALAWYAAGLRAPDTVKTFSKFTFAEGDLPRRFTEEICTASTNEIDAIRSNKSELYRAFKAMCINDGFNHVISPTAFASEIERLGFNKQRWRPDEPRKYLCIKPEFQKQQHITYFNKED